MLQICDTVVTTSSTLGLELAAFYGKKPILSGNAYYSSLGLPLIVNLKMNILIKLATLKTTLNFQRSK